MTSTGETRKLIEHLHNAYAEHQGITWAVAMKDNDVVLGFLGIQNWSQYHHRAEIGHGIARSHWEQGIASEAIRAIIRFGFEEMNLNHIYAGTIADNYGSVGLLEKIGFHREGTRRKFSWEDDGTFHDSAMYELLGDEYIMVEAAPP